MAGRRLGFLARAAREVYDEVFVIRADRNYPGPELEGVRVYPLPARDLRSVVGGEGPASTLPYNSWRRRVSGPLLNLRQSFPFLYYTDDGGAVYRAEALKLAIRLVREHGITHILSSFRPWSDHLVARELKEQFPHLYWIADFRDLHADPVRRDVWWPLLQRTWAKRVIASANEVWGVSEGQVAYLRELHPRVRVRRNPLFSLPPAVTQPKTDRFTIVYTGSLYHRLQSPKPLLDALNRLIRRGIMRPEHVELIYRGKDDALWRRWTSVLHPEVHANTRPYITPEAAEKLQKDAQLLLLLSWSAPDYHGVLTAKLYDYLSTGRPILALVNGPDDPELRKMIEGTHAGKVYREAEQPTEWLLGCYLQWLEGGGRVPWSSNREALSEYTENFGKRTARDRWLNE